MQSRLLGLIAFIAMTLAGSVQAGTVGYSLTLSTGTLGGASANVPAFILSNTSTAASITGFDFTIGWTTRNFDSFYTDNDNNNSFLESSSGTNALTGIGYTLSAPDGAQNGARSNLIDVDFTGFSAGKTFQFLADVDIDSANTTENFRVIFFNNGSGPNSQVTVRFSTGHLLSLALPDQQDSAASNFAFAQSLNVPEPDSIALLGIGLLLLGLRRNARARSVATA